MARPKLGDGDTQRLQMKITEAELAAIDDWRFENRISSRSEAVRRLVQIALRTDAVVERLAENAKQAQWSAEDILDHWYELIVNHQGRIADIEFGDKFQRVMMEFVPEAKNKATESYDAMLEFFGEVKAYGSSKSFDEAIAGAFMVRLDAAKKREQRQAALEKIRAEGFSKDQGDADR